MTKNTRLQNFGLVLAGAVSASLLWHAFGVAGAEVVIEEFLEGEEMWEKMGNEKSIFLSPWPKYDSDLIKDDTISLVVQINGKLRASIEVSADISAEDAFILATGQENVKKWLEGQEIIKKIFVPGKLLNIVVR